MPEHSNITKLKNIPSINCITLRESEDRRNKLKFWFELYNVKNYKFHIFDRLNNIDDYNFIGPLAYHISNDVKPIFISHFSVLRDWYENTNEDHLIVVEDDVSFKPVEYWNFTWEEFEHNLPENCMCVQLVIMRYNCEPYEFDKREPNRRGHWSACAYFLKREYVKHLIDSYNPSPTTFTLDIKGVDLVPEIEQVLFLDLKERVYVFPLFVEDCYVESTKIEEKPEQSHKQSSHVCAMNWWQTTGKNLTISEIIK